MSEHDTIRDLERASLEGMPTLESIEHDGWLLRAARGYSRRANCVMPLAAGSLPVHEELDHAEAWFAERRLAPVVKMTDAAEPRRLERVLADRGYERDAETFVLTRALGEGIATPTPPGDVEIITSTDPDAQWLATIDRLSHRSGKDLFARLLARIEAERLFVRCVRDGDSIGCARAVISGGWVGLYDLAVDPAHRGQGCGRALVDARLAWARDQGIRRAFLQVMGDNAQAQRLQHRLGFSPLYHYWYRVRPT